MDTQDRMGAEYGRSDSSQRREATGAADFVRERGSEAAKGGTEARVRATASIGDAIDYAKKTVAELREEGWSRMLENVTKYTRTQPLPALAIAAGLRLLVGRLTAPAGLRASGEPSHQPSIESGVHWPPRLARES